MTFIKISIYSFSALMLDFSSFFFFINFSFLIFKAKFYFNYFFFFAFKSMPTFFLVVTVNLTFDAGIIKWSEVVILVLMQPNLDFIYSLCICRHRIKNTMNNFRLNWLTALGQSRELWVVQLQSTTCSALRGIKVLENSKMIIK